MPKYTPPKGGGSALWWLIVGGFSALILWGIWEAPLLLGIVPLIAINMYFDNKRRKKKFEALVQERTNQSICQFARSFDCKKTDTWVIRAVYEQVSEYVALSDVTLPLKADDDIVELLEIDEEDFELDLFEEIAQRARRSTEDKEKNPYFGKVHTLRDLVNFFNEQQRVEYT